MNYIITMELCHREGVISTKLGEITASTGFIDTVKETVEDG